MDGVGVRERGEAAAAGEGEVGVSVANSSSNSRISSCRDEGAPGVLFPLLKLLVIFLGMLMRCGVWREMERSEVGPGWLEARVRMIAWCSGPP